MCGIVGYVTSKEGNDPSWLLRPMADAMRHRGPDDEGYFQEAGVGLAVRRLSIVDLVCGRQPISNEDGTIHVVFNGEIYNYIELRAELEKRGHRLSTRGDTETLVHLYEEDRKSTRLNSSHSSISYAVFCLKKKKKIKK